MNDDDYEPGLNLDNDSLIVSGDDGIPIKGFRGHTTTLTHEEQARIRQGLPGNCSHINTNLAVQVTGPRGGIMSYRCTDCTVLLIEGHVTTFEFRKEIPDDFNNPFITGQH